MKKNVLLLLFACIIGIPSCTIQPDDQEISTISDLLGILPDPPASYRTAPLWDWNDVITREEIALQLEAFKQGGLGGVFIHPRPGLVTEYLSEDWNQLYRYTVDKGKELGMYVWIYDENSYPSGFAGGHVPDRYPGSYQQGTGLGLVITENLADTAGLRVESILQKADARDYYVFYRTFGSSSWWYGGFPYVDLLYPGVTDTFIRATMEGYEQYFGEEFGKTVPGVFTDEPNLPAAKGPNTSMRWTPDLFEQFENRWGYSLADHLISLVEPYGEWKKVRHNYHELMLELFLDRWAVPWHQYCEENNLIWTGHYWEHGWPIPGEGYDEAAFYMYHQMPGVDMLGRTLCEDGMCQQFGNIRAVRELASAANQSGAIRRFSETYGGAGWQVSFTDLKRLVDWQCVLGVNFVNQHLSYFSMQGVRKFDYPPSFSYQEPWWDQHKMLGDYTARISAALSAGEQINTVLILQPNTTAWMYHADRDSPRNIHQLSLTFKSFLMQIESLQLEYDLGSEQVLKRFSEPTSNGLKVGQRTYPKVIIPPGMENLDSGTLSLLNKLLENGLELLVLSDSLAYVDGTHDPDAFSHLPVTQNPDFKVFFGQDDLDMETVSGNPEVVFHQRRQLKDGELLFIVNSSATEGARVNINWKAKNIAEIDLLTGKAKDLDYMQDGAFCHLEVDLPAAGSVLLYQGRKVQKLKGRKVSPRTSNFENRTSKIERLEPNILTIDYLDLETKDFELRDQYFMNAMYKLFEWSELPTGNPWQHKIQFKQTYLEMDDFEEDTWHKIRYHFSLAKGLTTAQMNSLRLVAERPDIWKVRINGQEIHPIPGEWWLDRHFPMYNLAGLARPGQNTIELSAQKMSVFAEVMPVYILGDFDLLPAEKGFTIVPPDDPEPGSWADNGWPFYSGKVAYTHFVTQAGEAGESRSYWLQVDNWKGTVAQLFVNDELIETVAWQKAVDIGPFLKSGENKVEFIITGTLKNTLGFHHKDLTGWIDGPFSWNQAPEHQPPGNQYRFVETGL